MPFHAFKVLDITWTDLKTFKTRDTFILYYVSNPNGTYEVLGISGKFIYRCWLSLASDITDFVNNFKTAATSTAALDDAIGSANLYDSIQLRDSSGNPINSNLTTGSIFVQQASAPTIDTTEGIWQFNTLISTATTADQTVLTYTVPAGKTFYVMFIEVAKCSVNNINADPAKLFANGVELARASMPGGQQMVVNYQTSLAAAYPLVTAGQIIKLTVTPTGTTSTTWSARLLGALK